MSLVRLRLEFRVELNTDKPRMILDFDDFDQVFFWIDSGNEHSCFGELFAVIVVEFVAMTVTFGYFLPIIGLIGKTFLA